jgi:glycosyltransferase involved in cell wall biosynthesis
MSPDRRPLVAPRPARPLDPGPVPSFSVVIAAYQAAGSVREAVASALEQTVAPQEVIVCDDGSTDDIEGALEPYRDRIVFLRRKHGGEGAAKNSAVREASGEFVVILDADDAYLPERIGALGEGAAARPDLDILTTDAYLEVGGRRIRRAYEPSWHFEVTDQRRGILNENFIFGHTAVRRHLLLDAGGFDESILWTTDWECWVRLIFGGARAGLIDEPLSLYRLHEGALSSRRAQMLRGGVMTLEKAASRGDLTREERAVLDGSLAKQRRAAGLEEAKEALVEDGEGRRDRLLAIARSQAYGFETRLKAAGAALAPRVARRLMLGRRRRGWVGAGGVRVERKEVDRV